MTMGKRRLDQYQGVLSASEIAAGINAANANARRLADDAERLLEEKRYPTAAALAALAIEEAGKASILRELALARTDKELCEAWRNYRTHTRKNVTWLLPSLVAAGARHLEDFRSLFDPESDHPSLLDQVKQIGFYTDCLGQGHWSVPQEVIDESLARMLVRTARLLARDRVVRAEEIELWIEYVGPVWQGPTKWLKKALAEWHRELVRRGLVEGAEAEMADFIWKGEQ